MKSYRGNTWSSEKHWFSSSVMSNISMISGSAKGLGVARKIIEITSTTPALRGKTILGRRNRLSRFNSSFHLLVKEQEVPFDESYGYHARVGSC